MKNLKVWQKLMLLGLVFLLPLAGVTYKLIDSINSLGVQVAARETAGVEYLTPLRKLNRDLQDHLNASPANVRPVEAAIEQDVRQADDRQRDIADNGQTAGHWAQLKSKIKELATRADTSPEARRQQHESVSADMTHFIGEASDASSLSLDPDLNSYYLVTVLLLEQQELVHRLGTIRALAANPAGQAAALQDNAAVARYLSQQTEEDLEKACVSVPRLRPVLEQQRQAERLWVQRTALLAAGGPPGQLPGTATAALDASMHLQEAIQPALSELLGIRLDHQQRSLWLTLQWAFGGLLLLSLIGIAIIRDITGPLDAAVTVAEGIASGNLAQELPALGRRDEVGALSNAFSGMVTDLRTQVKEITEGFNLLGTSAGEMVAFSSQLAASATQTATGIAETTTTVEEVRQTANLSSQKAQQVANSANHAAQVSRDGLQATEANNQGMRRIREQMDCVADSMVRLSERSQTIGDIIATVDDLAQQSNLLAVNAAIEAAKAGEHGKGFGVVAQEVRSLAEQSRQATTQVRSILSDIQKATGGAVMATEQGSKAVDAGFQQSTVAGESILALADSFDDASQAATQIAASSHEQLVGMEQVVLAMESIKQASLRNVDNARQLETAARNLDSLGHRLQQVVQRYRL